MEMQQSYRKSLFISVLLHVFIIAILIVSFDYSGTTPVVENSDTNVINAVAMSAASAPKKVIAPHPMQAHETPPAPAIKKPPRVIPIEKPREIEPKKDVIAIDNKKLKKLKQEELQKELLAEIKKHEVKQKKIKQKSIENEFAKELKDLSAKSLQQQLLAENKRVTGEREQKARGEVDKYKALILQSIGRRWLIPSNIDRKLSAQLLIFLAPGGTVVDVQIAKSSGNEALDSSARAAVFKSSPLPVPPDSDGFEPFRRFILVVKPMLFDNG